MQVPPDFSAVKVNGVRAYKLARDGKKAALQARLIKIFSFQMTDYNAEAGSESFLFAAQAERISALLQVTFHLNLVPSGTPQRSEACSRPVQH
jgi:tRNA U55 pseudouridine synthase TruB